MRIKRSIIALLLIMTAGCTTSPMPRSMSDLVFLTRDGCVQTDRMRERLDEALKAMDLPRDYQFIDLASLQAADGRTGYPTPTVLYRGDDIFGMAAPSPPFPEPT